MKESDYISKLKAEKAKLYQKGLKLLTAGDKKEAVQIFDKLLKKEEFFVPALNKKAVIYIYQEKIEEAESILKKVLQIDPDYAPALTNLGSIAKKKGNLEKAKAFYQKAITANEDYGPAYNNLGVIYREEGNYAKSVKYLKKARKFGGLSHGLDPDKAFYQDKGCLFVLFLFIILIAILYIILF